MCMLPVLVQTQLGLIDCSAATMVKSNYQNKGDIFKKLQAFRAALAKNPGQDCKELLKAHFHVSDMPKLWG